MNIIIEQLEKERKTQEIVQSITSEKDELTKHVRVRIVDTQRAIQMN